MLARSGRLPTSGDHAYEVKWDGFRAIVSTEGTQRVRSRRGWDMTPQLGFLADLPVRAILDGELVALDANGQARLPVSLRMRAAAAFVDPADVLVFDVWSVDGDSVTAQPYTERG
jgi:bifunctional non-homologous end joining protein LigD